MQSDVLDFILQTVTNIYKENPDLFSNQELKKDWFLGRKYYLKENERILELLSKALYDEFHEKYSKEELFYMQKLFVLYPNEPPKQLLSLPWSHIKCILNLCEEKKRKFYIHLCIQKKLNLTELKYWILNDLYEKSLLLIQEVPDSPALTKADFLNQLSEIQSLIWE